jgi:hypothetical protein
MGKITDKINGWGNGFGVWFRYITQLLLGLLVWNFVTFRGENKQDMKELINCFANHLAHHQSLEKELENRLSVIETLLRKK